jgi:hypothetical protein
MEPVGNRLTIGAAAETSVAMDEAWYVTECTHFIDHIDQLYYQAVQAEEICRRQRQENKEIRHKASKVVEQKDEHIAELTKRLNDLVYHADILNDDEAIKSPENEA